LADGKHVLVAVDANGARLYRTLMSTDAGHPERLVPLMRYNHSSKYNRDEANAFPRQERAPQTRTTPQTSPRPVSTGKTEKSKKTNTLPDAIARAVLEKLVEIDPETILIAAHGKGKGDAARALCGFAEKRAPRIAKKIIGRAIHLESEKGGRRLTEPQLLATARRAYRHALAPRVSLESQKQGHIHGRRVRHV
jgi:hypothetical protein